MKIYTRSGDGGETGLPGGTRRSKSDVRVTAYGEVDELNASLGFAVSQIADAGLRGELREIQRDLLALGADLAAPPAAGAAPGGRRLHPDRVRDLETLIDRHDARNEPLRRFLLPGGAPGAAALHVCRTVCRRAERAAVRLSEAEEPDPTAVAYLNRLSDLLFVLARRVNAEAGVEEETWEGGGR